MTKYKDIAGRKFYKLTAIRFVGSHKNKRALWLCHCDCGNEVIRRIDTLHENVKSSCGCPRNDIQDMGVNIVFDNYRSNSKKKKIEFNLTKEELKFFILKNCYYCDSPPSRIVTRINSHAYLICNGIDRLDNNIGYIFENCVSCCTDCNFFKNKKSYKEFWKKINIIYECINKRNVNE
jgi:hypothetical protein